MTLRAKVSILLGALTCGGCYRPKLAGESFYCHPTDNPACPDGQTCVGGRCVSPGLEGDGGLLPVDLSPPPVDDGSMSTPMPDLTMPASMPDLSTPPDLKMSCVPSGGNCNYHNDAICCNKYCNYSSETCK